MKLLCLLLITLLRENTKGEGQEITWKKFHNALDEAKTLDRPLMFLMSKSWCNPCKKLSESLEKSEEFIELSKQFTLALAVDDEVPKLEKFDIDGKYVPKIVFQDSNGNVLRKIVNADAKDGKAQFFYKTAEQVISSMKKVLEGGFAIDSGFGRQYNWKSPEEGFAAAKAEGKPILMLFQQSWCGSCQRLKPLIAASKEMEDYIEKFVFVITDDEKYVKSEKYKADGEYYPKILFLDSDSELIEDEINEGTPHKHVVHYYADGKEVSLSMKRVLEKLEKRSQASDNGFGKHINWVKYDEGLRMAKQERKPMMVLFHKSYCGACKAMKPRVRNSKEIGELSKSFVMVNIGDDDDPDDPQFDQDGAYIPRIFFLDSNGKVEVSIYNNDEEYKKARFAYGSADTIVAAMKKALVMQLGTRQEVDDNGFGKHIQWLNYEDGLREAKRSHKASMLLFYNDYCMFSTVLKQQIRESSAVAELSTKFAMILINEEQQALLKDDKFNVDGLYTPRIMFMDPDQNLHAEVNNTNSYYTKTMFYYATTEEIVDGMKLALEKINLTLGRGFGEYIRWVTYETGLELAKQSNRPMMLIVHKSWCQACRGLKPIIANSRPIWELSLHFVMVNVEDEEEPLDNQFFVDGSYYPRIFVLSPEGKVVRELHNQDPSYLKYKYSYGQEDQLLAMMKRALVRFPPTDQTQVTGTDANTASTIASSEGRTILAESGIRWIKIVNALEEARIESKPILFLIHRTTCPACKAVLRMLARDPDFKQRVNANFIAAEVEDDVDEKTADQYMIDGGYVPRLYFLDHQGAVMKDIWNVGTQYLENKFYYYEMSSVLRSMDKALQKMKELTPSLKAQTEDVNSKIADEVEEGVNSESSMKNEASSLENDASNKAIPLKEEF